MKARYVASGIFLLLLAVPVIVVCTIIGASNETLRYLSPAWVLWAGVALVAGLNSQKLLQSLEIDMPPSADFLSMVLASINVVVCLVSLFVAASA